jgi:hypothetical protein
VSEEDPDRGESFEERLRAAARELSESVERIARLDRDEIADRIDAGGERLQQFAEFAGQWLSQRLEPGGAAPDSDASGGDADKLLRPAGPHPLDTPTEEQALALSALESGRWRVESGTNELVSGEDGASPAERVGLVSELRARDWITAAGEVTLLGRDALKRWADGNGQS